MRKYLLILLTLSIFFSDKAYAGLSFLKTTTIIAGDREDILLRQKFYSEGDMLRIEEDSSGIEGNPGIRIYDFKNKKLYTIMLDLKLYMVQDIEIEKDYLMFEIPPEKKYANFRDLKIEKAELGKDPIEGHPATRHEVKVIRSVEKGKEKEEQVVEQYGLWIAEDLNGIPIKYEFPLPHNGKKIINYTGIKTEAIDPSLFSIPEGYIPVSPF